jgi:hypothetical protein
MGWEGVLRRRTMEGGDIGTARSAREGRPGDGDRDAPEVVEMGVLVRYVRGGIYTVYICINAHNTARSRKFPKDNKV